MKYLLIAFTALLAMIGWLTCLTRSAAKCTRLTALDSSSEIPPPDLSRRATQPPDPLDRGSEWQ
jgi:hypothetical protein